MSANEILEMLISERIKISQALQYTRLLLLNSSSVVHLDWVTSECNGYDSKLEIPDYRKIPCSIYARIAVPYYGITIQPVQLKALDDELTKGRGASLYFMHVEEGVENVEKLAEESADNITMVLPKSLNELLDGHGTVLEVYQQASKSYLQGIITAVKNKLINILLEIVQIEGACIGVKHNIENSNVSVGLKSVFISYSYDNHNHEQWVKHFADTLKANGVKTIFDKDLPYGSDLSSFMLKGISDADVVLVIGTPIYFQKTQQTETTGVRFEDVIITNSLMANIDANKFIPILRQGTYSSSFPLLLSHRKGIDFSDDSKFDEKIKELLQALMIINP